MSEVHAPVPDEGPVAELLVADAEGRPRLRGGRCRACHRYSFPLGTGCPWCGTADPDTALLSSEGTLWGWTAVTAAPPGYAGPVPFGFGVVDLPEGVRIVTRLTEPDPAALAAGQAVRLTTESLPTGDGDDLVVWAYEPVPGGERR
jgi:uncharacterized OB-fold protein